MYPRSSAKPRSAPCFVLGLGRTITRGVRSVESDILKLTTMHHSRSAFASVPALIAIFILAIGVGYAVLVRQQTSIAPTPTPPPAGGLTPTPLPSPRINDPSRRPPPPEVDIEAFRTMARAAPCADIRNELYRIDNGWGTYVFWLREGNCADNRYAYTLFGLYPADMLCSRSDSVAGEREECRTDDVRTKTMFRKMVEFRNQPTLGLGPEALAQQFFSAAPSPNFRRPPNVIPRASHELLRTGWHLSPFCRGYCTEELLVTPEKSIVAKAHTDPGMPLMRKEIPLPPGQAELVAYMVERQRAELESLSPVIGCPSCGKGNEWIEFSSGGTVRRVDFPLGDDILGLDKGFLLSVRARRADASRALAEEELSRGPQEVRALLLRAHEFRDAGGIPVTLRGTLMQYEQQVYCFAPPCPPRTAYKLQDTRDSTYSVPLLFPLSADEGARVRELGLRAGASYTLKGKLLVQTGGAMGQENRVSLAFEPEEVIR